ncbi:MAG: hypothetical protein WCQ63_03100 [Methanomethylophilus sp.]|nr:hypothetical protein [Methanomethylophilus sp.]MDD4221651.1 hypothetical protein [Methanomethylophilus sp.]
MPIIDVSDTEIQSVKPMLNKHDSAGRWAAARSAEHDADRNHHKAEVLLKENIAAALAACRVEKMPPS